MAAIDAVDVSALFINGTVGSGKTTTAEAVGSLLQLRHVAHAVIDLDALSQVWPAPATDRFNLDLVIANLTAVAANCRAAGARRLVLSGVLERVDDRARYATALGADMLVCRLVVPAAELRRRLISRHPPGPERQWHLNRAGELEAALDAAELGDVLIKTAQAGPVQVAQQILDIAGWA